MADQTIEDAFLIAPSEATAGEISPQDSAVARYVADMTTELARMATNSRFRMLAYLLKVAALEASRTAED